MTTMFAVIGIYALVGVLIGSLWCLLFSHVCNDINWIFACIGTSMITWPMIFVEMALIAGVIVLFGFRIQSTATGIMLVSPTGEQICIDITGSTQEREDASKDDKV